jgi:hypothetical protein
VRKLPPKPGAWGTGTHARGTVGQPMSTA